MLELESKPVKNYTNYIPENVPSNPKTHKALKEYERVQEQITINEENKVASDIIIENTQKNRVGIFVVRQAEVDE